ncbi:MAG: aminotransferase, partial [Rothia sp.]|nr:aminotransferase [Rothia sp. (in: high G+C Gram-positive bacteria)]
AEAAAIASIEHEDAVMERVSHLVSERERVTARLCELGYEFPSTYANFVWLPLGERTGEFVQLMAEHALSVRAFGTEGVRVSIGEVEANDRFLSLCEVFAKGL